MSAKARIIPFGDSALLVQFGDEIDLEINRRVHALDACLRAGPLSNQIETVPAYSTLLVQYDPLGLTYREASAWVSAEMDRAGSLASFKSRQIEVPVRYGGEAGIDLEDVAAYHHIRAREVVRLHCARAYVIFMMGFTPGFPYMGKLDDALIVPRLETPRMRVIAGSVGIAGAQTGIYPIDSPGGWRIIGRTSLNLFDPGLGSPFLFSPGDSVRFVAESIDV
jgi:KipI family sensor histidine kinase inhibitor